VLSASNWGGERVQGGVASGGVVEVLDVVGDGDAESSSVVRVLVLDNSICIRLQNDSMGAWS